MNGCAALASHVRSCITANKRGKAYLCFPPPFSLYCFKRIVQAAYQLHKECRYQRQSDWTDEPRKTGNSKAGHKRLSEQHYRSNGNEQDTMNGLPFSK